jgi:allophanate hydrolase subunit 1
MTMRYSFGGDEHLFVEVAEEMSLDAFFQSLSMTKAVRDAAIAGVTEICPANASFQLKFDPDVIAPDDLLTLVRGLEAQADVAEKVLDTRIIEWPVLYGDPWTHETMMRFRERHQDPTSTDLAYAARVNGYADEQAFIAAHAGSPWFVSMVGFVAGLPFLYQMVERDKQIEVPKYLRPRTDTPKLTIGHGGCFGAIYSVRGAGGYQMFGITPAPVYDPEQKIGYMRDFMCFFRPGDILKFRAIDRAEYDQISAEVAAGTWMPPMASTRFVLADFLDDPAGTNARLVEALHA